MNESDRSILSYYLKLLLQSDERISEPFLKTVFDALTPKEANLIVTKFTKYKSFKPNIANKITSQLFSLQNTPAWVDLIKLLKELLKGNKQIKPNIKEVGRIYQLSNVEMDYLQMTYFYFLYPTLKSVTDFGDEPDLLKLLGYTRKDTAICLAEEGKLKAKNIIDYYNGITPTIASYIAGVTKSLLDSITVKAEAKYPIESFPIDKETVQTLIKLLRNVASAKILIYGEPGTGKTQFATSLAHASGKSVYFLIDDKNKEYAFHASDPKKDVIVLDEADDHLNESQFSSQKKGKVNAELDYTKSPAIYITNEIDYIDQSVLRRFHYILKFETLNGSQRAETWQNNIKEITSFLTPTEIKSFSNEYNLPMGIISNSAKAVVKMTNNRKERKNEFIKIINAHKLNGKNNSSINKAKSVKQFRVDYLNTRVSIDTLINHAKRYASGNYMGNKRFSMLFHGVPGSGKSELGKYLAEVMGYSAHLVFGSDIFSKWLGESEHNIRKAFENADGKVLIFDEADSLLSNRVGAMHSWERSTVNEFLAQMDIFKGVLICTTNLLHTIDPAAIRRFDRKVEFLPLLNNQIENILCEYFPEVDFTPYSDDISKLKNVTPGDIAVIAGRFWEDDIKSSDILDALKDELTYKQDNEKIAGFASKI